jgi:hypothetical protein
MDRKTTRGAENAGTPLARGLSGPVAHRSKEVMLRVKSPKRERQYEHIKKSELQRGRSPKVAKRIAAATTNKTRRAKGETKKR